MAISLGNVRRTKRSMSRRIHIETGNGGGDGRAGGQVIVKEKTISERLLLRGAGPPLRNVQEKECSERHKNVRK